MFGPPLLLVDQRTREQSDLKFIRFGYRFHEEFRPGLSLRAPTRDRMRTVPLVVHARVCACVKSRCAPWSSRESQRVSEGVQEKRDGRKTVATSGKAKWWKGEGFIVAIKGNALARQRSPTITLCHATSTSLWPQVYRCPLLYPYPFPSLSPSFPHLPSADSFHLR